MADPARLPGFHRWDRVGGVCLDCGEGFWTSQPCTFGVLGPHAVDQLCADAIDRAKWVPVSMGGAAKHMPAFADLARPEFRPFWSPELPELAVGRARGPRGMQPAVYWWGKDRKGPIRRCALVGAFLLVFALPAGAQTLFGTVTRITDGDTLTVGEARIRLYGIDAPESRQECQDAKGQAYRCGDSAEAFLLALAPVGSSISCGIKDVDRYGRLVAVCSVASRAGSDLGRELVLAGWAVAYRKFSDRYVAEEIAARNARRGLWAGSFQQPEEWRHGH